MRPSSFPIRSATLPTRRTAAGVLAACSLALSVLVGTASAADAPPSLSALRGQRAELIARIAALTDASTRAQAQAADAAARRAKADADADVARRDVARYAVDAYVDGVQATQVDQLRRRGWADLASQTDRHLFAALEQSRNTADAEQQAAERAIADARTATDELQQLRLQLEQTIADREQADRAADEARRLATPAVKLTTRPHFGRTTRLQGAELSNLPFGVVSGVPDGLAPTGQVVAGPASWYGPGFDGRPTASGAIFDQEAFTVASKELPMGTILLITYGGRSVLALVNDRGPYVAGRVLDLSHGVASALGTLHSGVARVSAQVLAPA